MKNQKGFSLVWSMAIITVVAMLVAGALTFGMWVSKRSVANVGDQQAYFTALSALDAVAKDVAQKGAVGRKLIEAGAGSTIDLGEITMEFPDGEENRSMGTCTVTGKKTKDEIQLTAKAEYGESQSTVHLTLLRLEPDLVPKPAFGAGVMGQIALNGHHLSTAGKTDVYAKSGSTIFSEAGESVLRIGGNLICSGDLIMNDGQVGGVILADGVVDLTNVAVGGSSDAVGGVYTQGMFTMYGGSVDGCVTADSAELLDGAAVSQDIRTILPFELPPPIDPGEEAPPGVVTVGGDAVAMDEIRSMMPTTKDLFHPNWQTPDPMHSEPIALRDDGGTSKKVGTLDRSTVYEVASGESVSIQRLYPSSKHSVIILLRSGSTLSVDEITPASGKSDPSIFLVMESGSELIVTGGRLDAYVYGSGRIVTTGDLDVTGCLHGEQIVLGGDLSVAYQQPLDPAYLSPVSSGRTEETWIALQYQPDRG